VLITNTTATQPSVVRPLKCLICGNPASSHISYSTFATFLMLHKYMLHKYKPYRPVSTDLSAQPYMSMAIPPRYLLRQESPLFTLPRTYNLHNSDLNCTPPPLPLFNIFSGSSGSPATHSKVVPLNTLETRMQTAVCHVDMAP